MAVNGVKEALVLFSELSVSEPLPIDIVSPAGKHISLMMRTLKADEITAVRKLMSARPQAPVGDMRRNPQTGAVERIRNEEDSTYVALLAEYNQEWTSRCMYISLIGLEIPGETDDERLETFKKNLDAWAYKQLVDHFNRINGFGEEAFSQAREELTPLEDVSTPSSPASAGGSKNGKGSTSEKSAG